MAESIKTGYKRLFAIRLLHHYWLDEGSVVYDLINDKEMKHARLLSYDMRQILSVAPTASSERTLKGLNCIYKETALGCVVAAPEKAEITDDTSLEFAITVRDPLFYNYTALTLRRQNIFELFCVPEKKIYRFKENVPFLSNLTGASRGASLFLSREIPGPADITLAEALYKSGNALMQLTGDNPGGGTQLLSADASAFPVVHLHQGDVQSITQPAGLSGAPAYGIRLTGGIPDTVFALIHLRMRRQDDERFSLLDGGGRPKDTAPLFEVRFKNRSTIWKYFKKNTGELDSAEVDPLPLTYFGNAGTRQKPSAGRAKPEKAVDGKIDRLVSEIYV